MQSLYVSFSIFVHYFGVLHRLATPNINTPSQISTLLSFLLQIFLLRHTRIFGSQIKMLYNKHRIIK